MTTIFAAIVVLLLVIAAMAVGVIFGRKPIAGSCGGLSALGMKSACDVCGGDQQRCDEIEGRARQPKSAEELAYDAAAEPRR